jgi:hypothetical protein
MIVRTKYAHSNSPIGWWRPELCINIYYSGTGANESLTSIGLMYLSGDRLKMSSAKGRYDIFNNK